MINDRLGFQRFLGLTLTDKVPDANTLWDFKEALTAKGTGEKLFEMFTNLVVEQMYPKTNTARVKPPLLLRFLPYGFVVRVER